MWSNSFFEALDPAQFARERLGFSPGLHQSRVLNATSPRARQSAEFLRKSSYFLEMLGIRPRGDGDNEISLLLPNQSRVVGLPGKQSTIRGFCAVSLLLIDEASRVPDALYLALRPSIATSPGRGTRHPRRPVVPPGVSLQIHRGRTIPLPPGRPARTPVRRRPTSLSRAMHN